LGAGVQDSFDLWSIGEAHWRAGRVQDELVQEIAGELAVVGGEMGLEFADIFEGPAVAEFAARVDDVGQGVTEIVSSAVDTCDFIAEFQSAITRAPASEDIEVLEREARGVKAGMAVGAGRVFGVPGQ
jgi:hypothetical protein